MEFCYKDDELGDPILNDEHCLLLGAVKSQSELDELKKGVNDVASGVTDGLNDVKKSVEAVKNPGEAVKNAVLGDNEKKEA